MQITRFKTQYLHTTILIVVGVLVWVLMAHYAIAWAAATYTDSAHGDNSEGVNRSGAGHDIGDCANCHDTFDDSICGVNPLMLFEVDDPDSQTANFCFQCHKSDGAAQQVTNYTYSKNFGGGNIAFTTIYDAFNPTIGATRSSHNLADIQNFVAGYYGFTTETNACVVCHNYHAAQQNYPVTLSGVGGVGSAIRRVIDHESLAADLWGDEDFATSGRYELTNEFFEAYGFTYQAPYYKGGSNYEPAGDNTSDGSNLPEVISFCLDCHKYPVPSTERGGANLRVPKVENDQHGTLHNGGTSCGACIAPYTNHSFNYVLSCTDCHEPHGSQNEWLLRTTVNGKDVSVPGPNQWMDFCTACHTVNQHTAPWGPTTDCYNNGICHHHGAGGGMF